MPPPPAGSSPAEAGTARPSGRRAKVATARPYRLPTGDLFDEPEPVEPSDSAELAVLGDPERSLGEVCYQLGLARQSLGLSRAAISGARSTGLDLIAEIRWFAGNGAAEPRTAAWLSAAIAAQLGLVAVAQAVLDLTQPEDALVTATGEAAKLINLTAR
jgi:hypothetical protein